MITVPPTVWPIKGGMRLSDYDIGLVLAPAPISAMMRRCLPLRAPRLVQRHPSNPLPGTTNELAWLGPRRKLYPRKSPVMLPVFDYGDQVNVSF